MLAYLKFKFGKKEPSLQERHEQIKSMGIPKPISKPKKVIVHVDDTNSEDSSRDRKADLDSHQDNAETAVTNNYVN